jgi:predicted transcriptional regulator
MIDNHLSIAYIISSIEGMKMAIAKTEKEVILNAVQNLPDDTNFEEAMGRLYLLSKVERGLQQADEGQTISHEEAIKRLDKWLK